MPSSPSFALEGTVLCQDLSVSGISEVSGVAGDGEREQAVTEEEDMIGLSRGKGGSRYGLDGLSPVRRNCQSKSGVPPV